MSQFHWFNDEEIAKWGLQTETWAMLDMARQRTIDLDPERKGVPFILTSGKRTEAQEAALVGGVRDSSHISGYGCDISATDNRMVFLIIGGLISAGFKRIILYHDAQFTPHHIHVDNDPSLLAKTGAFLGVKLEQN